MIGKKIQIPLKYKILSVMLFVMFVGFGAFFYFAHKTFSEDKKLFVMELNLAALKATISELKLELRGRIEELQIFVPRVYLPNPEKPFHGLSGRLEEEVLGVTFLRAKTEGPHELVQHYKNLELLKNRGYTEDVFVQLDKQRELNLAVPPEQGFELVNRSFRAILDGKQMDIPVLTVLLNGSFMNEESKDTFIAVDLLQDFLRKKLQQVELTEIFLLSKKGTLLSHADTKQLVDFAASPLNHPVVKRIQEKQFPRESLELDVGGESYLCNVSETGFADLFAISQVKKSQAFLALKLLMQNTLLIALLILSIALVLSIVFAAGLTRNIKKLKAAAESIAQGSWEIHLDVDSNDEIKNVAESFQFMADNLNKMVKEVDQKARMEEELETARLVQSTLLANPETQSEHYDLAPFFLPASECGGDFWDVYQAGTKLTVVVGDATGHGAGAAIVTAVAKSSFSTINTVYGQNVLPPDQFLHVLNKIVYKLCKGQLLMTACVIQLDLATGEIEIGNAGHESPLLLKNSKEKGNCEVLFSRGERLGFSLDENYTIEKFKLSLGETILLYTDGVSESTDKNGKELGERSLKKLFSSKGPRPVTEIRRDIEFGTRTHIGESQIKDDITFVLLNWKKAATVVNLKPAEEAA